MTRNEDREFQLEMLRVQITYESRFAVLTTLMATAITMDIALFALSFAILNIGIPLEPLAFFELNIHWMMVVLTVLFGIEVLVFAVYQFSWIPRAFKELHERFIKPEATEKLKQK